MKALKPHTLCSVWPQMTAAEKHDLIEDIKLNSVLEPVVLFDGQILDGFHRYNAALKAGVPCKTRVYDGDDPAGFVISRNAKRRHLRKRELAIAVATCRKWAPPNTHVSKMPAEEAKKVRTTKQMADEAGVSESTMQAAKRVVKGTEPAEPAPAAKPPKKVATQEVIDLKDRKIRHLEEQVIGYEERIKSYKSSESKEAAKRDEVVVNQRAEITTLKSQVKNWQTKYSEANSMAKSFERKAKKLQAQIERINLAA